MTNREFLCWLNGYFTLTDADPPLLSPQQWRIIENHFRLTKEVEGLSLEEMMEIDRLLALPIKRRNSALLQETALRAGKDKL